MKLHFLTTLSCAFCAVFSMTPAAATADSKASSFGTPGVIDMPTAEVFEDGLLLPTLTYSEGVLKQTLAFQITPRVFGSFRYSVLQDYGTNGGTLYDRSFDVGILLMRESKSWPSVVVGLRDFGGTGVYGGEYIAATKHIGDRLALTGGIGWGRLGSYGGFENPLGVLGDRFKTRDNETVGKGGQPSVKQWFTGDAAFFAGVRYALNDQWTLRAEYSSDAYVAEVERMGYDRATPINVGLSYGFDNGTMVTGFLRHGTDLGLIASFPLHPDRPAMAGGVSDAPPTILPRDSVAGRSWRAAAGEENAGQRRLRADMAAQGLRIEALNVSGSTATVHMDNLKYGAGAQALGRAARVMANTLPASVEQFRIVLTEQVMPVSVTMMTRADLEAFEHHVDGSREMRARSDIRDGWGSGERGAEMAFARFDWSLTPYLQTSLFDPDDPFRIDVGLQAYGAFSPRRGLVFSGALRQPVAGSLDGITRRSDSILPHVRSDAGRYAVEADAELKFLTAEYFFRPGRDLFGRLTAGYLETMYGGVSGEILWAPVDNRLALGLELNYARQRDFDQLFGFQDYDVVTGHASAYYDFGNGFVGQLDAGRYLAGDWGATVTLERAFKNGVRVGAFATFTDVSFDDFGEGSFDKGIRITLPIDWLSGEPSREDFAMTIRPILRDGGARLNVRNRLYGVVHEAQTQRLEDRWGLFWR